MDVSQFSAADFDCRRWINAACLSVPADETLERHLAGLETRLSLAGEDLEASLVSFSDRALRCIPAAAAEANALQEDVAALQGTLQQQVTQLAELRDDSARSTGTLAVLDGVKSRMEEACSTLKEAAELSDLFKRVDAVFAGGDVVEIAALLTRMRASLALVGHVPEFAGGLQRLSALEDRFQGMVEGSLATAFSGRRPKDVAQLGAMMHSVGRGAAVQKLFLTARAQPLQTQWDSYSPSIRGGFPAWLPTFYKAVTSAAEDEARWLGPVLPKDATELVGALVIAVFNKIEKSFRMRLNNAFESVRDQAGGPLSVFAQLHALSVASVRSIASALKEAEPQLLQKVAISAYQPFEAILSRYGDMESRQLAAEIGSIDLPGAPQQQLPDEAAFNRAAAGLGSSLTSPITADVADVEGAVAALASSTAPAVLAVQSASGRAEDITGGTGLPQLLAAADVAMSNHCKRQESCLHAIRTSVFAANARQAASSTPQGSREPTQTGGGPDTAQLSDEAAAVLPLLSVSGSVLSQVALLDSRLRATVAALAPTLERTASWSSASADPIDPVLLRLFATEGALLRELQNLVRSCSDVRYSALPAATSAAASFQAAAEKLVYDILMIRVEEHLAGFAEQPCWAATAPTDFGLPSFSAYPGTVAAGAGEYLLMLPQLLEAALESAPALEGTSAGISPAIDGDWLDKVAAGAAAEFLAQLKAIPRLSAAGSAQAAADTEYLANVLSALGVLLPQPLATWQLLVGLSPEEFAAADTSALQTSTVEHIARVRGLSRGSPAGHVRS